MFQSFDFLSKMLQVASRCLLPEHRQYKPCHVEWTLGGTTFSTTSCGLGTAEAIFGEGGPYAGAGIGGGGP